MISSEAAGFLTVVANETQGVFGGYLVLNQIGRPLEFHCTAPVQPNRAQEILYGPTLEEFLYAEQIGQTLVNKSSASVPAIYTDMEELLALRHYVSQPVSFVLPKQSSAKETEQALSSQQSGQIRIDRPANHQPSGWHAIEHHDRHLLVATDCHDTVINVRQHLDSLSDSLDLLEPFERIREAITEAQIGGR